MTKATIVIGGPCNNACSFCGNAKKSFPEKKAVFEKIKGLAGRGANELAIAGGEPTLWRGLFDTLRFAKKTGFGEISLNTNGRMLCYKDFAKELAAAGCTEVNISLFSADEKTHDGITGVQNSWAQAVSGIENAQETGLFASCTIPLLPGNFRGLPETAGFLVQKKVRKVVASCANGNCRQETGALLQYSQLMPFVWQSLVHETKAGIFFEGIPPCLFDFATDHVYWNFAQGGRECEKAGFCVECKFFSACPGIPAGYVEKFGSGEFAPVKDKLRELKLEITARCNADCGFCYNKNTFASNGRPDAQAPVTRLKRVIKKAAEGGLSSIRFMGGEPLLHPGLFELAKYAKGFGLYVVINTNGILLEEKTASLMHKYADEVAFSLYSVAEKDEKKHYSGKFLLGKKRLLNGLQAAGIALGVNTAAEPQNIAALEKFNEVVGEIGFDFWHILRPMPPAAKQISNDDVESLVEKLRLFKKSSGMTTFLKYSIPYCAYDPGKVASISTSYMCNLNSNALTVGTSGGVRPSAEISFEIGNVLESPLEKLWSHPFIKGLQQMEFVPGVCKKCRFVALCRGGSRHVAKQVNGSYHAMDPLAQPWKHEKIHFSKKSFEETV